MKKLILILMFIVMAGCAAQQVTEGPPKGLEDLTEKGTSKWSSYSDMSAGTIADGDTFLVRDISDATTATGFQFEYPFSVMISDLSTPYYEVDASESPVTVSGDYKIYYNNYAGTTTYNLPATVTATTGKGKTYCFRNLVAQIINVNPDNADYFHYNTDGAMTAGEQLESTGAIGEYLCVTGMNDGSNDYWVTWGISGTWAQETP